MKFRVRMVYTERMLFRCDIVAKNKIKLEQAVVFASNGSDRVMRNTVGLSKNIRRFIGVGTPLEKNLVCKSDDAIAAAEKMQRLRPDLAALMKESQPAN